MANNNHFNLTLDTAAPSGSVSVPSSYSTAANITVSLSCSASDVAYMKVWLQRDDGTVTTKAWEAYSTSKVIAAPTEGIYTAHAIFMDDIGNESAEVTSGEINYDKTAPTITTFTVADPSPVEGQPADETNSLTNNVTIVAEDIATDASGTASGISKFVISCSAFASDYTVEPSSGGTTYTGTVAFKTGTAQGSYTISVYALDKAGNKSAVKTFTIFYDDPAVKPGLTLKIYKDSYTTLADYVNSTTVYGQVEFEKESGETAPHIVGYRIWADGTTEPSTWVSVTKGSTSANYGTITVAAGDGSKKYNARAINDVGNETDVATYSFVLDQTNPTASISADPTKISASGTTTKSVITFSANDANIASYVIDVNGTTLKSGSANVSGGTAEVTASTSGMKAGDNTIKITVTDKAGNSYSTSVIVELDTSAPTATWKKPTEIWYNKVGGTDPNAGTAWTSPVLTASKACTGKFWFSDTAEDKTVPSTAGGVSLIAGDNTIATTDIVGNNGGWPVEKSTVQYLHVYLEDDVGNTGYAHASFKYDETKPTTPTITFSQDAYSSTAAKVTISGTTDSASGLAQFKVTGDIASGTTGWVDISAASNYSVTLTSGDGIKSVTVIVRDVAGNASSESAAAETELDTATPEGALTLRVKGTTTVKPSPSNVADVDLFIELNDDLITAHGKGYYKIWGDFNGGASTEGDAEWVAFDTAGSTSKTISVTCTSGDGTKVFYAKLKDNAGNVSDTLSAQFVYDTTPIAVWAVSDYAKVSKVHTIRWSQASVEIDGKYNDQVVVTVKTVTSDSSSTESDDKYIAYKAVAYADAAAAKAGSHEDAAIDGCSETYSTARSGAFTFTITGANFEKALNGGTAPAEHAMDGAHIVTVYVQDEAGTWSKAAEF